MKTVETGAIVNGRAPARLSALACLCLLTAASGCGGKSRLSVDSEEVAEPDGLFLLDDMEPDGEPLGEIFHWGGGFVGAWSPGLDLIDDIVPPRATSTSACHMTGAGVRRLTAVLDAYHFTSVRFGEFHGLVFYARFQGTGGRLIVGLGDDPESRSPAFSVSSEWQRFELSFDELSPTWDRSTATIAFIVGEEGEPFDFWLDDVSFVCRGACEE